MTEDQWSLQYQQLTSKNASCHIEYVALQQNHHITRIEAYSCARTCHCAQAWFKATSLLRGHILVLDRLRDTCRLAARVFWLGTKSVKSAGSTASVGWRRASSSGLTLGQELLMCLCNAETLKTVECGRPGFTGLKLRTKFMPLCKRSRHRDASNRGCLTHNGLCIAGSKEDEGCRPASCAGVRFCWHLSTTRHHHWSNRQGGPQDDHRQWRGKEAVDEAGKMGVGAVLWGQRIYRKILF